MTLTCPGGLPSLLFSWTDNANNDTDYYLDINGAAWTGDSTPSPWGVKTLTGNGATTGVMSWTWSGTAPVDTGGDTDPVTAGNQLTPQQNKTYWWRVIARNNSTSPALYSSHIYPNGGTGTNIWPGTPVAANCSPNLVVTSVSVPTGDIGSSQNASVTIQNTGLTATSAAFEVGVLMISSTSDGSDLTCSNEEYGAPTAILGAGTSRVVTVPVFLPLTLGTYKAAGMADSDCQITPEVSESDNTNVSVNYQTQGFDLSVSITSFDRSPATYDANEIATATVTVTNSASSNKTAPAGITVGVWPYIPYAGYPFPDCSTGTPGTAPTVGANNLNLTISLDIPAGTSRTVNASFDVGDVPKAYTAHAYVISGCSPVDYDWTNNSTANTGSGRTYQVIVKSFFEGSGGDVGSQGTISVSRDPLPASSKQSNYLVAGQTLTNIQSTWKITNYPNGMRQVPTIVYPYLKEVFYDTANDKPSVCNFSSHNVGSTPEASSNYCNSNAVYDTGAVPASINPSGVAFWFIDGKLDINSDIIIPSSAAALVIVVRDDVFIHTNVIQVDAIIVAGQTFHAQTSNEDFVGAQLKINGAVYTGQSDLKRILGGGTGVCGSTCDNAQYPAIVFNLDPKYLVILTPSLGTPALGWKEVAP